MLHSTSASRYRVAVLGAAGGIGKPLSLLLKNNPLVTELRLYDIHGAPTVAADLSHVAAPAVVRGYDRDALKQAVDAVDVAILCAGVPRRPGMTRNDLFTVNSEILRGLIVAVGEGCPKAITGIVMDPLNSILPVAVETLRKCGTYDPARVLGITSIDQVRARTFVAQELGVSPYDVEVPVIGGHSGETIVPLLSGFKDLSMEQVKVLTHRIQFGGDEVVKAKAGAGSATLSMAYAVSEWTNAVLKALRGDPAIVEYCMVETLAQQPACRFFSCPVKLSKSGVETFVDLPELSSYEKELMARCLPVFSEEQLRGITYGVKKHLTDDA